MRTLPLTFAVIALSLGGLWGCEDKGGNDARNKILGAPAPCETDKECADGFVCNDKKCVKGERTAAEKQAEAKKKAAEKAAKAAAKTATKPGEGKLVVRICPFFKNIPEAIGTIIAVNQETKKRHLIHLAMVTPELGYQSEFTFYSLPLGTYDVTTDYGIQKGGVPDIVKIKCDPKAKPCRDELIREMTVVLPENDPPREKKEDGTFKPKACDFVAE